MLNLTVDNSTCRILGLSVSQFKELRELMSYLPDPAAARFAGLHRNGRRYLINKRCEFPTGLLYLFDHWVKDYNLKHNRNDIRRAPRPLEAFPPLNLPHTPYLEQEEAGEAAPRFKRGIVTMPTGTGKSLAIALIIAKLKVKTLVVVPSLELKTQLTESLSACFGRAHVGNLKQNRYIAVENVDALDMTPTQGYDCVIIDEFHHAGAKTYRELNKKAWNGIYYRFGMTATPFRSQDHERLLLEGVLSHVIYHLRIQDAIDKGYIVPIEAYYIDLPKTKTEGYTWAEVYKELVTKNDTRNLIISQLLLNLDKQDIPTLCLVKEVEHGHELRRASGASFVHGVDTSSRQHIGDFNAGRITSLIGTTGILGEGVDTKPAEYVIIAGLGKSKNAFMQQIGRGVRVYPGKESCKVILLRDSSHKWTLNHFNAQRKILLDEYGIKPVKLKI